MLDNLCKNCFETTTQRVCPYCGYDRTMVFSQLHLKPGTILQGKYMVGMKLGQGGFGITYLAYDLGLGLKVAIKEFLPTSISSRSGDGISVFSQSADDEADFRKGREDFIKEGEILARLRAVKSIVSIYEAFTANNTAYLVMELLEGETLSSYLKRVNKISVDKALTLLIPVMDSLDKVHKVGLLHRDISPDNIYIQSNGQVKLLDFGAARFVRGQSQSMTVIYKEGYAPLEQYTSKKQGPWTDVYGLATTFYRCITGVLPTQSIQLQIDNKPHTRPSEMGIKIKPNLENVLMKAMSLSYVNRYQTVGEFQNALIEANANPTKKVIINTPPTVIKPKKTTPKPSASPSNPNKKKSQSIFAIATIACILVFLLVYYLVNNPVEINLSSKDNDDKSVYNDANEPEATNNKDDDDETNSPEITPEAIVITQPPITPVPDAPKWDVTASSHLVPQDINKFNYEANNVMDGQSTGYWDCWIPGNIRSGEGEYLVFRLNNGESAKITMIRIQNGGYRLDREEGLPIAQTRYCRNCRAKEIMIRFDGKNDMYFTLDDMNMEFQDIELPDDTYASTIVIKIISVYNGYDGLSNANNGKGNKDLMISEIEILGYVSN